MTCFKLTVFVLLTFSGPWLSAQTNWPSYIGQLQHDASESPVAAVVPTDALVQAPAYDIAASKARWSGIWSGWGCQSRVCDVKLVVETVGPADATVIYVGASDRGQLTERVQAVFSGDELKATLSTGTVLRFRFRADPSNTSDIVEFIGHAQNELRIAGVLAQTAALTKAVALIPMPPLAKITERIPTAFLEYGTSVTLEVVIFKPLGAGPFPTLMFNHGSTGNGDQPASFISTYTSASIARFFTDKGWLVAFPQRRGRGKSGGLYDEGFEVNRSRYACASELSLPGVERALADLDAATDYLQTRSDVDGKRMVVGGVSRGGILAVTYAGTRPTRFQGAINFVGGWVGDRCRNAEAINTSTFKRGAPSTKPMLWLYGDNDPFYRISHSRKNFEAFISAGGKGVFKVYTPPAGQSGHGLTAIPALWQSDIASYLRQLDLP